MRTLIAKMSLYLQNILQGTSNVLLSAVINHLAQAPLKKNTLMK